MLGQERSSDMKVVRSDVQTPDVPTNEPGYWQDRDIRLRPVRPKDAERWLLEENTDSEADHFLNYGITLPKSQGDAEAFADRYANFNNADERIMFSTETLDGELAGGINLRSMNQKNGTFETGTRLYRAHRGKGYGFQAKLVVLRYAFYELRFQKYTIRCLETNAPMVRHAEHLGCQQEGWLRRQIYTQG